MKPISQKPLEAMIEPVESATAFGDCPAPTGGSQSPDTLPTRHRQEPANEQSRATASLDKRLAVFLWRGVWRACFDRAWSTCSALERFDELNRAGFDPATADYIATWSTNSCPREDEAA